MTERFQHSYRENEMTNLLKEFEQFSYELYVLRMKLLNLKMNRIGEIFKRGIDENR